MHVARLPTLKPAWHGWAKDFGDRSAFDRVYDEHVDIALMLCEYSPKVTGVQPIEDLLPLVKYDPQRMRPIANLNPHLHFPGAEELQRQLDLGAVALKIHPVHGG